MAAHWRTLRKTLHYQLLFLFLSPFFVFLRDSETYGLCFPTYDGAFESKFFPGSSAVLHSGSFTAFESLLRSHQTDTDNQDATPPGEISSCFTSLPERPGQLPVLAEQCGEWNSGR